MRDSRYMYKVGSRSARGFGKNCATVLANREPGLKMLLIRRPRIERFISIRVDALIIPCTRSRFTRDYIPIDQRIHVTGRIIVFCLNVEKYSFLGASKFQ